jgi:peptidyl-prolyl cis-trans isomerase C
METGKRAWRKGILISVVVVLMGALALNGWALNSTDEKNSLLVTVEDVKITRADLDHKIDTLLGAQAGTLPPEQVAKIRSNLDQRVIQNMIIETLLTKAVNAQQITVTKDEVNQVIAQLKTSLPPSTDFKTYLEDLGFSENDLVQAISKDLKIKKLLEAQVAGASAPTDEEIQQFYDENSDQFKTPDGMEVRHILIAVATDDDEAKSKEKLAKAENIRLRLLEKNEDFAAIATAESDCPSKAKGGNIGVVTRGRTVKPFEDAVYTQKVGEIGPVVKTQFGYHIIQVMNLQKAGTVSLAEAKPSISDHLASKQKEEMLKAYIASLKSKAKIVYHDKALKGENPA